MKYIFVIGAPGSKWSSVVRNIYYSPSIDCSDSNPERTYRDELHLGAYWDPGMEFGQFFHRLNEHDHYQCETEFDAPFTGSGVKIIKSHHFALHIDFIKSTWPDCPIVLAHRPDDACLGWWVKCGGFDIAYPDYTYYKSFDNMAQKIQQQNASIVSAVLRYPGKNPLNNQQLAQILGIDAPPAEYQQNYGASDVRVTVI